MFVDCQVCPARGERCEGCIVTELYAVSSPQWVDPGGRAEGVLALEPGELHLDGREREAVALLVGLGLVDAAEAATLRARREPWEAARAVG